MITQSIASASAMRFQLLLVHLAGLQLLLVHLAVDMVSNSMHGEWWMAAAGDVW